MRLIRGRHNLHRALKGGAVTIGNFDGVHRGHQAMLDRASQAVQHGPLTVVSFEPRPLDFFLADKAPLRVAGFRDKCERLAEAGVDQFLVLRFDQALAAMDPARFEGEILGRGLAPEYLLIGDDFRYGHKRAGDADSLARAGRTLGFRLDCMPTVAEQGMRISSTRIRECLEAGDLAGAKTLLGYSPTVTARVRHGRRLGRTLDYPTANLGVHSRLAVRDGVYVVRVSGPEMQDWPAIASLGRRPTVEGRRRLLEVHLFDWSGNLYGRHLGVKLLHHLRDEERFEDLDALRVQMDEDSRQARAWLAENSR